MKLALVILAGAADAPLETLGDRTPLAAARLPVLAGLAAEGRTGGVRTIPKKAPATFETALVSLFGEDPLEAPAAAGGLLATAIRESVGPRELAFRADFVNLYEGAIVDPTAGRIAGAQAERLLAFLQEKLGSETVRFRAGDRWRSLLVIGEGAAEGVRIPPPSAFLGEPVEENRAKGPGAELVRGIVGRATDLLAGHEINLVRIDLGENPADGIWIWGGGRPGGRQSLPGGGLAVGTHPSFLGLARERGLSPVRVEPGPALLDEPARVAEAALAAVAEADFTAVCLEGALLASRQGDVDGKVAFLEAADAELIRPLAERVLPEGRLVVVASHAALAERRREMSSVVPFLAAGEGTGAFGRAPFTEEAAEQSDLVVERGHELLEYARRA